MLIFIDTEFTDLLDIDLIAIGAVTADGATFYAERSDFDRGVCNHAVRENILPLLGQNPDRVFNRNQLAAELLAWLSELPGDLIIVFDYVADFELLADAIADAPSDLSTGVYQRLQTYRLGAGMLENSQFKLAREAAYRGGLVRHHALDDAKALRVAYLTVSASNPY